MKSCLRHSEVFCFAESEAKCASNARRHFTDIYVRFTREAHLSCRKAHLVEKSTPKRAFFWRRARDLIASLSLVAARQTLHRSVWSSTSLRCSNPLRFVQQVSQNNKVSCFRQLTFGGEQGIRTLETVLRFTRFPVVLLRPARTTLHLVTDDILTYFDLKINRK